MTQESLVALLSAIETDESNPQAWSALWTALRNASEMPEPARLLRVLATAMRLEQVERGQAEALAAVQILKFWKSCGSVSVFVKWATADNAADELAQSARELLYAYLRWATSGSLMIEGLVVAVRSALLRRMTEGSLAVLPRALDFVSAVATYAFFREYVFEEPRDERDVVNDLAAQACASGNIDPLLTAVIAMYGPLRGLPCAEAIGEQLAHHPSPILRALIQLDVTDWCEEVRLRATMPRFTAIDDEISHAVQSQYEENPYPRWNLAQPPEGLGGEQKSPGKILVAGCGTQQALFIAAGESAGDICAVDLSLTSLAYAKRLAAQHRFNGIRFGQADILALGELNEVFDLIECSGVLHHLREPIAGLRVLSSLLAPQGTLRLAVYAKSGRRAVPHAIALRKQLNLGSTLQDIRTLRTAIKGLPENAPAFGVTKFRDFFFASACRDLMFHVQEQDYDLPALAALIEDAGLTIQTLKVPTEAADIFRRRFPDGDPQRDFDRWATLEEEHEGLFGAMYRVLLRHRSP